MNQTLRTGAAVAGHALSYALETPGKAADPHVHLVWESRTQDREHVPAAALYPSR